MAKMRGNITEITKSKGLTLSIGKFEFLRLDSTITKHYQDGEITEENYQEEVDSILEMIDAQLDKECGDNAQLLKKGGR